MAGSILRVKGRVQPITKILSDGGVTLRKAEISEKNVKFTVYGKDVDVAMKILDRNGREYTLIKDGRKKTFFKKNLLRFGLLVGFALAILTGFFYSENVTRLEISGNKVVSNEAITEAVNSVNALPSKKNHIDCDELVKKIISVEGISSASAEIKGNVLKIGVLEEPPLPSVLDRTDFTDIVSNYDGIITRIITYSGAPCVKKGDTVVKGQKLISCDRELADGITVKENALGDIYARVWVSENKIFTPTVITTRRTGRKETRVTFFGFPKKYNGNFTSYETECVKRDLGGSSALSYYVTTYYETEETTVEFDFFADEENIVKEETEKLANRLPEGSIPLRTWYSVKRLDKNVGLDIYYEIELKIS